MIKAYLHTRRAAILVACVTAAMVLLACLASGQTALSPVLYGLFLAFFVLVLAGAVDLCRFRARLLALRSIRARDEAAPLLPPPLDAQEAEYQRLLSAFYERAQQQRTEDEHARGELIAYYTMWLHQVKTPIAALRLLMERGPVDPSSLSRELFAIERYTGMALEYARLLHAGSDLVIEKTQIEPLVRQSVKRYAEMFIAKHLRLRLDPIPLFAHTDEKWFCFILEQLLSNAVKYTQTGGVHIYVQAGALCIADSGIGIRPEDLPRVFEAGYTGANGRLDKRASGLGLSMAQRAAKMLAIRLTLTSTPGKGTTARLVFPAEGEITARVQAGPA